MTASDTAELDAWSAVLTLAGTAAIAEGTAVVSKGALNIKTRGRELAPRGPHTPHYRASITYDLKVGPSSVDAMIGPDWDLPQGALGVIFEQGTRNNRPMPHMAPAGDEEEPRYYAACEALAASLVERWG